MAMRSALALIALLTAAGWSAHAEVAIERPGQVESLPEPPGPHWVWVADVLLQRSALLDLDDGRFLGMISTGYGSPAATFPQGRREFYLPETHYSRGSRGTRTDVVTIYDAVSLSPLDEVEIPPKRAMNVLPSGNAALSDDERFLAVFNMTPATSLSIVDVQERSFVGEIATPGCSLVYAAGPRRFALLCADGSLLTVSLDAAGREAEKRRSEPFFDPQADPVTEKAVRLGNQWIFVSFEGFVHPVDVSGPEPRFGEVWSLLDDEDRAATWRIGGGQHLALHQPTGRLYSLMHRGGPDTHKQPGLDVWIYDLATRTRVQRLELRHPGFAFLTESLEFGKSWIWPFNRLSDWLLYSVVPNPGLEHLQVTQDDEPLLVTGTLFGGSLAVYDALSGRFMHRVAAGSVSTSLLQAPGVGRRTPR